MKYKPIPRYTEGLVVEAAGADRASLVGRAFPQPMVQTTDGEPIRLDDVLGPRIAVVGLVSGVAASISDRTAERLRACGGVLVRSAPAPTYLRGAAGPTDLPTDPAVVTVVDIDGVLRDLLLARPADEVYVVRPDRYVGAVCRADDLDGVLGRFLAALEP
jgi:3-(3-hydroxy-phenyl)propionate hydroxylase